MRSSIALSALVLLGTVTAQQSFLSDYELAVHNLQQGKKKGPFSPTKFKYKISNQIKSLILIQESNRWWKQTH